MQTPFPTPTAAGRADACTTITFQVNPDNLTSYTDEYIAQLWHISQANPAAFGDADACNLAERLAREIVRRYVSEQPPALWTHQGRHVKTPAATPEASAPASHADARTATLTPPAIGRVWPGQGGVYLGIGRGEVGQPAQHLIVATAPQAKFKGVWGEQGQDVPGAKLRFDGRANTQTMAAAGSAIAQQVLALEIDGHADYFIGSQAQLQLACANAPELFEDGCHWSSTQGSRGIAFVQNFEDGSSDWNRKGSEHRVRAFRGLTLEPLSTLARSAA